MALDDLTRYQSGELARYFYASERDRMYVGGAIARLADDLGTEDSGADLIRKLQEKGEGTETIIETYSEKYKEDGLKPRSLEELKTHYEEYITEYLDEEEADKVRGEFDKFSKEIYKEISDELEKADYILNGEREEKNGEKKKLYDFSEKEKRDAREIIEKYRGIDIIIKFLEEIKFENLRGPAVRESHKKDFKTLVDKALG